MFQNRSAYPRRSEKNGLVSFQIAVKETNLNIQAHTDLSHEAIQATLKYRQYLEIYIRQHPEFRTALSPLPLSSSAPAIVMDMMEAARKTNVGPMAAVAGAMAEYIGRELLELSPEVLVENGGDIFVKKNRETVFSIYAGISPLSMSTGLLVEQQKQPFAVCTSSGTLGHSKSFGTADTVSVLASSCVLADAAATALCNRVKKESDIEKVIHQGKQIQSIRGIAVIKGKQIGLWGDLKIVKLT